MPLYCVHDAGATSNIYIFDENTAHDATATTIRTFRLPPHISNPDGITLHGNDLYIADDTDHEVYIVPANTANNTNLQNSDIVRQFNLPTGLTQPFGVTIDGNDLYITDNSGDEAFVVPADTANGQTASTTRRFNLPSDVDAPNGIVIDGNDLYIVDSGTDEVFVVPADTANGQTASTTRRFNLPSGLTVPFGVAIDGNDLYIADNSGSEVFVVPADTANGQTASTTRRFNLPSGLTAPRGLAFESNQATLTITTTDTDIRAGETVDFDITSDIDISDFVASDITVTNGTRGTLTETDAQNFVLSVVPSAAGTLTVAISENVVSPGNASVSEDFTVSARISGTITFDESELDTDGTTEVTVTLSETPDSNLASSGLTTDAGTLTSFSGSGTSYTATLTAPSSGDGTITVTLAADAVEAGGLGNLAATATIDYEEPPANFTVTISGDTDIEQGEETTLTAEVQDADGNVITDNLVYAWTVSGGGAFDGATDEASVVYSADTVSGDSDVTATVSLSVTRAATTTPVITDLSLNNAASIGLEDVIVNIFVDNVDSGPSGTDTVLFGVDSTSTIASGSDQDVSSTIEISRFRISSTGHRGTANNDGTGHLRNAIDVSSLSLYLLFDNGNYYEIEESDIIAGGQDWLRWQFTNTDLQDDLVSVGGTDGSEFVFVIADSGSIGVTRDSGEASESVTVRAPVATTLEVVSGNNQSDTVGEPLDDPLVVRVLDQNDNALSGVSVSFSTTGGTLSASSDTTDSNGQAETSLTLPDSDGDYTVTASVTDLTDVTFTATADAEVLTVTITGDTDIEQDEETTLTAEVQDPDGNVITDGLTYAWTVSGGGAFVGATNEASVEFSADTITGDTDTTVTISLSVTRAATDTPTITDLSLANAASLGLEDVIVNIFADNVQPGASGTDTVLFGVDSTTVLATGSDQNLASDVRISRFRISSTGHRATINNDLAGHLRNTIDVSDLSLYLLFDNGNYYEVSESDIIAGGQDWTRWQFTDTDLQTDIRAVGDTAGSEIVIVVADAGSVGYRAGAVSGSETVTVRAPSLTATTLEIVSGNNQTADAETELTNPLIVQVNDQNGDALSGVDVSFSVSPTATLSDSTVTTDSNGQASVTLTLGSTNGDYTVTASVSGLTDVEFTATAEAVATTLEVASGNNQTDTVGEALDNPLVVRVEDQNGDGLSGITVNFTTTAGTLSASSDTTDSSGEASVNLTLPDTAQSVTVTASSTGLTDVTFTATATAEALVATTLEIVSGNNQTADAETELSDALVVRVLDQNGDALSGTSVSFSVNPTATLSASSVTTGSNGQASVTLTLGSTNGDYTVTASVSGLTDVTFTATAEAVATTLEIVSGNNQTADAETQLTDPLIVQINDQNGDALSGITVTFAVSPTATLSATSVTTDSSGQAETELTLGSTNGDYTVTASSTGLTDVEFTATADAVPTTLAIVSGNNQTDTVGEPLDDPLIVQVNDQNGDALSGITVTFSTTGGTLSATSVTTDSSGQAETELTLPDTADDYTVTASSTGLTDVEFTATAEAEALVATTLTLVSGDNQTAEVETSLDDPLVVRVDDQNGDALSGVSVTFSINPTDGALGTENATTDSSGEASTTVQLGETVGDYTITASVTGLTDVTFTATAEAATTPVTPTEPEAAEIPEGSLFSIDSNGDVTNKGYLWFTDRAYSVFGSRLLVIGDDLHIQAGYGNPDAILKNDSVASKADNHVHLVFGQTLRYILPTFQPDSSIHAELSTLAKNVNGTVAFDRGIISIKDRLPFRSMTDGATGTGTGDLSYDGANKPFNESGWLLIGSEVIRYTGLATGVFTGIERGVLGTEVVNHFNNSRILYLNDIIRGNYLSLSLSADTNRLYNIIRNSDNTVEVRDEASIALYGERPYTLDITGLTRHENAWIEDVFNEYLQELKDLQDIVNLTIPHDFSLQLGQIVPFIHNATLKAMRITSIGYEFETTIRGRTITV